MAVTQEPGRNVLSPDSRLSTAVNAEKIRVQYHVHQGQKQPDNTPCIDAQHASLGVADYSGQ